jgi:signal transduction histidine kinase
MSESLSSKTHRWVRITWAVAIAVWLLTAILLLLRLRVAWDGAWISLGTPRFGEVTVVAALPDSPLRVGDQIVAVNGYALAAGSPAILGRPEPAPWVWRAGETVAYRVMRDGHAQEVAVLLRPGSLIWPHKPWGILLFGVVFCLLGGYVLHRRPDEPAARWMFLIGALLVSFGVVRSFQWTLGEFLAGPLPALYMILTLGTAQAAFLAMTWLALVFPRPHCVWQRWPWLAPALGVILLSVLATSGLALTRASEDWMSRLATMMTLYFQLQLSLCILAAILFLTNVARLSPADRQPAKWVALGAALALIFGALLSVVPLALEALGWMPADSVQAMTVRQELTWVVALVAPVSFAAAILRYRLFDIELVLNRTLVYGMLTASTIGIYVALVSILSALLPTGNNQVALFLGTGVVAVLFQPLRQRLQRGVNRLMYGKRDDPYAVLAHLGDQLGATLAPDAVAPSIVQTLGQTLKFPYIALSFAISGAAGEEPHLEPAAVWGTQPAYPVVDFPLSYQQQAVGLLQVAPRAPGERFAPADRRLLQDLARQVGVALAAVQQARQAQRLATDLQSTRQRLVAAREEERRRLRRDLHDGLGPALASLTLKVDAARDELDYDVPAAGAMLVALKNDIQAAVVDIRRLVYDLRPPALDDLGLVTALRMQAAHYQSQNLTITVEAPEHLPSLPAAVEVALYRIAAEAMTNVVRHAQSQTCLLRLLVDTQRVEMEISDAGCGLAPHAPAGVGLISMRERAAELGGECMISSAPGQGTRVHIWLPLPPAS